MKCTNVLALAGLAAAQNLTEALGSEDSLSGLATLVSAYPDLLEALSQATNITILAPDNDALASLMNSTSEDDSMDSIDPGMVTALLQYHVLNGTYNASLVTGTPAFIPTLLTNSSYTNVTDGQVVEAVSMDDTVSFYSGLRKQSNVTTADIGFDGGVIHIINEVLSIPGNVTDTAIEANLTGVAGAIAFADLGETIDGLENITVFAPNTQAFKDISSLFADLSEEDLASILQYHVVVGTIGYSSDLSNMTLETVGGESLNVTVIDDAVYVNSARVVQPDVLISNGVLHVIDVVLNPNATGNATEPNPSTTQPAFPDASEATGTDGGIPFTTDVPEATGTSEPTGVSGDGGEGGEGGEDDDSAAPKAAAGLAFGAVVGLAVMMANAL